MILVKSLSISVRLSRQEARHPSLIILPLHLFRYEIDRSCKAAVKVLDEQTVEVTGQRGPKQFMFDAIFMAEHGQETVFEDTKNLVQSALDGCENGTSLFSR